MASTLLVRHCKLRSQLRPIPANIDRIVGSTDPDLDDLVAWQNGDNHAGNRLLTKYTPLVYRFFDRKIAEDVSDLVQVTFEACIKAKDGFEGRSTFRTFLYGIAANKFKEHLRARRKGINNPVDFSVTSLADLGLTPTQWMADEQQSRLILEGMRRISFEHQLLLELYFWEKLTGPELAELYACPEDTVRGRIRAARKALVKVLGQIESDPVALASTTHDLDDHISALRDAALGRFPVLNGKRKDRG